MTAMQVSDFAENGRTFQDFESEILPARLSFSVMVTPAYDPIKGLIPAMFGCRHCGTEWMITSPAAFGTCRDCGRQLELIAR